MKHLKLEITLFASAMCLLSPTTPAAPQGSRAQADALVAWRAEHGFTWRVRFDDARGGARLLYGGKAAPAFRPTEDAEFALLARDAMQAASGLHAVSPATLVDPRVRFLPLGLIGSSDKVSVQLRQEVNGVGVRNGWVDALFDLDGHLLALDIQALAGVEALDTEPALSSVRARAIASAEFRRITGLPATAVGAARLFIYPVRGITLRPVLAWSVETRFEQDDAVPEGYRVIVDAQKGNVLASESTVHSFDVSGTVSSNVSPGTLPDTAGNPAVPQAIPNLRVTNNQNPNVAHTDANGFFNIPGATPGVQATFVYDGLFTTTVNSAGADYSLTQTLNQGTGNSVLMNPNPTEFTTSQANSANWINRLREYVRAANPSDGAADQVWLSNVNFAASCAAFYNGSVNFGWEMSGCVNAAYSSVVLHEVGHGLNVNYGTGNSQNGMGEGMADVFAMYVTDDPVVGRDFCGSGCFVRTGLNTRPFCGDCCPGCHAGPHANGEVLMGAYWKVRRNLKQSLGNAAGSAVADGLLSGWNNGFDQMEIESILVVQWVTLDDDDGDLQNGSPHFADINAGFVEQGFPGLDLCTPSVYCTPKTGLVCGVPQIGWSGMSSAGATSGFEVFAGPARGLRAGILLYGDSGPAGFPFQGGFLCVNPPLSRSVTVSSGGSNGACDGEFRLDLNAFASGQLGGNPAAFLLLPGQIVNVQWWGRDSVATGSLLSDGLEYPVCP